MCFDPAEGVLALPSPELTCFGKALQLQRSSPIFFFILPVVPLKVALLVTGEASPGLHLLGLHGMGHFHLQDRIIG